MSDSSDSEELSVSDSGSSSEDNELFSDIDEDPTAALLDARIWCPIHSCQDPRPPPPRFPFTASPAVHLEKDGTLDILYCFESFFDEYLINLITEQTNLYADQCIQSSFLKKFSRAKDWHPVKPGEIRVFFGLIILQGIVSKPVEEWYWSKKQAIATPFFAQVMSYRRFVLIKRYLHFSDNSVFDRDTHRNSKLNKIWPVIVQLNKKFSSLLTPDRDLSIDESLMLYKGRLGWIQYIPLKRSRFGVKTFMLCESKTGYIWSFIIYTGKGSALNEEYKGLPKSSQIVLALMKPLLGKGYCVTTDNYYTSPELADLLTSKGTDTYGMLRITSKEAPNDLRQKKLKKGEFAACQRGKVMVMKWHDKKVVSLLSTVHNTEFVDLEKRGKVSRKLKLVVEYNHTMGGVDRADQHLTNYPIIKKRGGKVL
ncbi:hypothetical protein J437_LFUL015975 [Ladona fulva]|uniref:PiggyBac transposable element-derived protein domain-containing protein n=1 Tax=Ladona fulva TaxID=123851 RepID=A0A8K0KMP3_LADFU|nr:hypothetical protein J437_LFUL015975 [Ladona fulva]